MSCRTSLFRLRLSSSARTRPLRMSTSVTYQAPTRSFSEQRTSSHGQEKENTSTQDTPPNPEWDANANEQKARSPYAQWYADFLPGMIPIALLGSAVYIGLQLVQTKLANEKYLDEANARVAQLEEEVRRLQSEQEAWHRAPPRFPEDRSDKKSLSRWWW